MLVPLPWLLLQVYPATIQTGKPLQLSVGQLLQVGAVMKAIKVDAVDVLAMAGKVQQHAVYLLLLRHDSPDATGC
jgi:hypothetical protein